MAISQTHSLDLEFSSAQYAKIADASQTGLDFSTAMTLEMWIKFESFTASLECLATKYGNSGQRSFLFFYDTGGSPGLRVNLSSNGVAIEQELVSWSASLNTWYHVAMTYDGAAGQVKFYVDGTQQGATQTTAISSLKNSTHAFDIGTFNSDNGASFYFNGLIKDVRAWSVVRTATEINDNKSNCDLDPASTGLQGWWAFNNNYLDETSNNNDLTASGSPVFSTDLPYSCSAAYVNPQFKGFARL